MPEEVKSIRFFHSLAIFVSFLQLLALIFPIQLSAQTDEPYVFGTLQSDPSNTPSQVNSGIELVQLGLTWDKFEPQDGVYNQTYISEVKSKLAEFKSAGAEVVLGLGVQYTPSWIFLYQNSYYVNQYGDRYKPTETGKKVANMVFNQTLRNKQARYIQAVFEELGTDFYAVRLGGGWYGELNYPEPSYNGHTNSYWAYDANALNVFSNRPSTIPKIPNHQWIAGMSSANHVEARDFIEWYLNSLKDYHDWQIQTVRTFYPGKLAMMYPSWGIRPGQLESAIQGDLNGATSAEINGEVQRGFDFERFIQGITDPGVVVYTTWVDSTLGDDSSTNASRWNPVHYLATLAESHQPPLMVWGENTGRGNSEAMQFSISQMKKYNLIGLMWAFEPDLYDPNYASVEEYEQLVEESQIDISTTSPAETCKEDISRDGFVDLLDYSLFVRDFLKSPPSSTRTDINQDGNVDLVDYLLLVKRFLKPC